MTWFGLGVVHKVTLIAKRFNSEGRRVQKFLCCKQVLCFLGIQVLVRQLQILGVGFPPKEACLSGFDPTLLTGDRHCRWVPRNTTGLGVWSFYLFLSTLTLTSLVNVVSPSGVAALIFNWVPDWMTLIPKSSKSKVSWETSLEWTLKYLLEWKVSR